MAISGARRKMMADFPGSGSISSTPSITHSDPPRARGGSSFFGRRKGKTLRAEQRGALESGLPALLLDLAAPAPLDLKELFPAPVEEVRLEIGFGGGEHLLHEAAAFA